MSYLQLLLFSQWVAKKLRKKFKLKKILLIEINLLFSMIKNFLSKPLLWIQLLLPITQRSVDRLLIKRQKLVMKIQVLMMKWLKIRKPNVKWRKTTYFQFPLRQFSFISAWCYLQFIMWCFLLIGKTLAYF